MRFDSQTEFSLYPFQSEDVSKLIDRNGCLIECDIAVAPERGGQLDQLLAPLRRASG